MDAPVSLVKTLLYTLCSNYHIQDFFDNEINSTVNAKLQTVNIVNRPYKHRTNKDGTIVKSHGDTQSNFTCILKNNVQIRYDLLRGKKLRIATLQNDWPLSSTSLNANGSLVGSGIAFQIVKTLQQIYGFHYSIVIPDKSILGDKDSGILGLLYKGEADVAAAFVPFLHGRHDKLRWSTELIQNKYFVLMKRPKESASGSGLLAPFELEVWMLILLSLLLVGPIIYTIIKLRDRMCNSKYCKQLPMSNCVWFVYGALMKQGSTLNPMTDSSRMLFATWWLFVMILTAFYTANLTAFLTLSKFTLPIHSVEDIAANSYNWFTTEGGVLEHAIKVDGDLHALAFSSSRGFGHFVDLTKSTTIKELVTKGWLYLNNKRALEDFLLEDYINKTIDGVMEKDRCTFVITEGSYLTRSMSFAYPKHSILPELFNPIMLSFVESGIITQLASANLPNVPICPLNLRSKERQLRNSDLFTTYIVIISGFVAAGVAFAFELLWQRWFSSTKSEMSWSLYDIINHSSARNNTKNFYPNWKRYFMSISKNNPKMDVNGREYFVITTNDGTKRFVPVRPLSSLLFRVK